MDAERIKTDPRLPFGLPGVNKQKKVGNGNYLWISYFWSYLNERGRAGFVMSSQASSAGHNEKEVRRKIVETCDKVGIAFVDGVASSDAIVIRSLDPKLRGLILMALSSDLFVAVTAQTMREGSKMPRADWKQMKQYVVPLPPDGLLSNFDSVIQSIVEQLKTLTFANQKLRAARDLLLPRLMSGEIVI